MGYNSAIEWTHHTFNPWIGCAKVSTGCKHCYAETMMDTRWGRAEWGVGGTRVRTSAVNWRKPVAWNRQAEASGRRERVFCASLGDVFEDRDELDPWRADLFDLILRTPHLDWLLLTKRPENAKIWLNHWIDLAEGVAVRPQFVLPNVWIGTSVEDQTTAEERIPQLLDCPAIVRFLSAEPLLGHIYLCDITNPAGNDTIDALGHPDPEFELAIRPNHHGGIHWVIAGGESGHGARPMDPEWPQRLRDDCQAAGVPFFFKQWGAFICCSQAEDAGLDVDGLLDSQYTTYDGNRVAFCVGKKAAGRVLDGRTWDEIPEPVIHGSN